LRTYGLWSLAALTIAAWTGVLMRFGLIGYLPTWASNFAAVRHAHSHLMYFGWVTLALMALIWCQLSMMTGRAIPRAAWWQMAATTVAALLSFPAFWSNGYGLTSVGALDLPLGSMVSGLNGLTWFLFIGLYYQFTRRLAKRPGAIRLWDWSFVMLLLACVGALGLMAGVFTGGQYIFLQQFFLHLFLDLFAAGWFSMALLGVVWAALSAEMDVPTHLPVAALAVALTPTFLLGLPRTLVPDGMAWLATISNLIAAIFLAWHLVSLWSRRSFLTAFGRFGLVLLAVHILSAMALVIPGVWQWAGGTQLRVYYLHVLLLGWVSSLLLDMLLRHLISNRPVLDGLGIAWAIGVGGMLIALLGIGLAPLLGPAVPTLMQAAAWMSLIPATAALVSLASGFRSGGQAGRISE